MKTFILMVYLLLGNDDPVLTTQEFDDKQACVNAATRLTSRQFRARFAGSLHIAAICVPKSIS